MQPAPSRDPGGGSPQPGRFNIDKTRITERLQ